DNTVAINRRNHAVYRELLSEIPGISVRDYDHTERNNYHYIVVEVGPDFPVSRDRMVEALHAENILARRYFWPGCHRMKPYRDLFPHAGLLLPNTERIAERVLLLPNGSGLPDGAIAVIGEVMRVLANG
ncbi:MAG: DegT/DnrJ/EryC1/StrS family aminotransferase, partial [Methylococcaceae bacterium]|nr:DegT/DnrJ/EryC1/StrS family aminotransferase [Methylococcaceae bacterium]